MSGEPDLVINYDEIEDLGTGLETIRSELENSEDIADEYAEDVSHGDLADALEEFADNWSDKRGEIIEEIGNLAEIARSVGEGFSTMDLQLAESTQPEEA
ncbi:hypothetical protein [Streptomyces sp. 6N223]|uniref:hypothetical protein n=1 Tax=Streptomyces sp. 6N223 TaxID=3457412 RepID=UPI003FD25B9C